MYTGQTLPFTVISASTDKIFSINTALLYIVTNCFSMCKDSGMSFFQICLVTLLRPRFIQLSLSVLSHSLYLSTFFFLLTLTTAGSGQASCSELMNPHIDVLQLYGESGGVWTVNLILDCTSRKQDDRQYHDLFK